MATLDVIREAIADAEEDSKRVLSGNIIKRELEIEESMLSHGVAGVITGVRRCGKSVFARLVLQGKNYGYINFDDPRLSVSSEELYRVLEALFELKGDVEYIILDEIQNVNGWEKFVSRLVESKRVLVTGSNAKLTSKELATYLVGRHIDFMLFPFSFREFMAYRNGKPLSSKNPYSTHGKAAILKGLFDYLAIGGMPQAGALGGSYIATLYSEILERDIIQRYRIKDVVAFKDMANYIMANSANEITSNKLKNIVGIKTANTASKWISYLESAYLIFRVERFSNKLKERIKAPKKVYAIDTGFAVSVNPELRNNKGRLLENMVAIELKRRIAYWKKDYEIYYWKDAAQREVDFVIRSKGKTEALVQVTYASSREEIKEREIKALLKASAELKCSKLIVLTWDYSNTIALEGKRIEFVPAWRWLIEYEKQKTLI